MNDAFAASKSSKQELFVVLKFTILDQSTVFYEKSLVARNYQQIGRSPGLYPAC